MYLNKNKKKIIEKDLILLGAGHSNIEVLRYFGKNPLNGIRITLINNSYTSTYSGMIPGYIQGTYDWDNINIDLVKLCGNYNHRLIISDVYKIDVKKKIVYLKGRPEINYDYLSINLGIKSDDSKIIGASEHCLKLKPISLIKDSINKLLNYNKSDKNNNIVIIGAGAAGVEVSLAIRERLRQFNINSKITLLSKNSSVLNGFNNNGKIIAKNTLIKNNIQIKTNSEVIKVTKNYVFVKSGEKIFCKLPILATSGAPLELLKRSNLPLNRDGSIKIENNLLVSGISDVFATGDISSIKSFNVPKAGVFAVKQGKVLARNIKLLISNKLLIKYNPQKTYLSLIGLPHKKALAIKSFFSLEGKLLWKIKKLIDKRFIQTYSYNKSVNSKNNNLNFVEPFLNSMQCKGCANKIPHNVLKEVFQENINNGAFDADKVPKINNLYQTTDIISSIISDPFELGKIAAKHALNDIYAVNANPLSAQMIVSLPPALSKINKRDLFQLKSGADVIMKKSLCKINGGHSYSNNDDQIYLGFSIIGKKNKYIKVRKIKYAKLYLTGKIGSALVLSAIEKKVINGFYAEEVINQMRSSNFETFKIFNKFNLEYVTDISGFGLAIHANNLLLRHSSLKGFEISLNKIPLYKGARLALHENIKSSLNDANRSSIINSLNIEYNKINKKILNCIFDPQTGGGFLFILNNSDKKVLNELDKNNINYSLIGKVKNFNKKIKII